MIEKTQLQIDKLQDLKKGMMNELLIKGIGHSEFKKVSWGEFKGLSKTFERHCRNKGGKDLQKGFGFLTLTEYPIFDNGFQRRTIN